eukprot:TRINITY_DN17817_c0_g1_i1.p1 TRINITY_DN17817_c0_g1~~TRINITY_DN17817_c0_g1_i1.p1  ORF type:complete len:108 (-),score=53.85 TRINITY_DN17817_c0_g1_i1:134-457(-)
MSEPFNFFSVVLSVGIIFLGAVVVMGTSVARSLTKKIDRWYRMYLYATTLNMLEWWELLIMNSLVLGTLVWTTYYSYVFWMPVIRTVAQYFIDAPTIIEDSAASAGM